MLIKMATDEDNTQDNSLRTSLDTSEIRADVEYLKRTF